MISDHVSATMTYVMCVAFGMWVYSKDWTFQILLVCAHTEKPVASGRVDLH